MPDRQVRCRVNQKVERILIMSQNLIVKTGPLSKKSSRTKMNTKFWAVLRNDVLSWYESTAVSYFIGLVSSSADFGRIRTFPEGMCHYSTRRVAMRSTRLASNYALLSGITRCRRIQKLVEMNG